MPPTSDDDAHRDAELRYVRAREALTQAHQKMQAATMRYALGVDAAQKDLAVAEEALRRGRD